MNGIFSKEKYQEPINMLYLQNAIVMAWKMISLTSFSPWLFKFFFLASSAMLQNKERSPSESLPSQFKAKILECFGYTTAHGYGRVAGANESLSRRWFWLLVCAAAYGLFAYQLHDIILQYSARPLKTRVWIAHQQVRFKFSHLKWELKSEKVLQYTIFHKWLRCNVV